MTDYMKEWRAKNKERYRAYQREYQRKRRKSDFTPIQDEAHEKQRLYMREYRKKESYKAYQKAYHASYKEE